jgi:PAS domain-containing protein
MSDAVLSLDEEYRVVSMNHEAELLYNCKLEDCKGKNLEDEFTIEFNEPRDQAETKLLKTGNWRGELILHPRNKPPINILASSAVIFDSENHSPRHSGCASRYY